MKTKNVFTLTATTVTMEVFDLTGFNTGDDTSKAPLLATHTFDVAAVPSELADGEQVAKSLAAYGLSRLMQDRCSDYTDKKMADECSTAQQVADTRLAAYQAVYDVVAGGEFRARRATGASKAAAVDTFFAQALVDFLKESGKDMELATATIYLQQRSNDERKALRSKLAPYIAKARAAAQQAASELDLDALLG